MTDPREDILVRLMDLMGESYVEFKTIVRNRKLLSQDMRPAFALLDGDESARLTGDRLGQGRGGRVRMGPQLMVMRPQMFVILDSRQPKNEGVGTDVNTFRLTLVRIIAQDPVLLSILGGNGSMAYMGMQTDLKTGSRLDGEVMLEFAFTYPLDPT